MRFLDLQFGHLGFQYEVPFHEALKHLECSLQSDSRSQSSLELEGQSYSQSGNDDHYRNVDCAE